MEAQYPVGLIFLMMERGTQALLPRGKRRCPKGMRKMDAAFARGDGENTAGLAEVNGVARGMLRTRCAICPHRCRTPLQ